MNGRINLSLLLVMWLYSFSVCECGQRSERRQKCKRGKLEICDDDLLIFVINDHSINVSLSLSYENYKFMDNRGDLVIVHVWPFQLINLFIYYCRRLWLLHGWCKWMTFRHVHNVQTTLGNVTFLSLTLSLRSFKLIYRNEIKREMKKKIK